MLKACESLVSGTSIAEVRNVKLEVEACAGMVVPRCLGLHRFLDFLQHFVQCLVASLVCVQTAEWDVQYM